MNSGRANQNATHTSTASAALAARNFMLGDTTARRSNENTAIRIAPTATAEERHELLMSSPGVRTIASSIAYSIGRIDDEQHEGGDHQKDRGLDLLPQGRSQRGR